MKNVPRQWRRDVKRLGPVDLLDMVETEVRQRRHTMPFVQVMHDRYVQLYRLYPKSTIVARIGVLLSRIYR